MIPKFIWMTPEDVAKESLKGLEKGKVTCFPGLRNRLIFLVARTGISPLLLKTEDISPFIEEKPIESLPLKLKCDPNYIAC